MRKALYLLAGLLVAGATICSSPFNANAATTPEPVCPTWTLWSIVTEWVDAAEGSEVVDEDTVILVKPEGGGTEFATRNLDLTFDEPVDIEVFYELSDGASYEAGAVRLFYYEEQDADTLEDAPKAYAVAQSGTGKLTIGGVTKVGTVGVVYDASNAAGGKVTFNSLKIGDTEIKFKDVCVEATPSPTVSASASATATPSATVTTPAAAQTTEPPAGAPSLPVTGAPLVAAAILGLGMIVAGAAGIVVARKRRTRYEA